MTEPVDLDALASAYIDDELDTSDRVAAEANPSAMAKVAEFRRIADLLRSPVAVDPSLRDRSIAAALGQLDLVTSIEGPNAEADNISKVAALHPRRPRRAWTANPALVWGPIGLVAAGIVAVAVISLGSHDDGGQTSAITTFAADVASAKAGNEAESSPSEAGSDRAGSDDATSATRVAASATTAAGAATTIAASSTGDASSELSTIGSTAGLLDLGAVTSASELGQRLTGRAIAGPGPATTAGAPTTSMLAPPLAAPPASCPGLGVAVATATLSGTPVVVHDDPRGGYVIVDPSCAQVSRLDAVGTVTP